MEVTSERGKPRQGLISTPVLIGRDSELRQLVQIAVSPPAIVLVEGEAGVGKSRLVREMAQDPGLAGRRLLVGNCHRMREPFPVGPFVEALRDLTTEPPTLPLSDVAGALRPLLPELAPHLPPPLDPLTDPRGERHRVFRGLRELLGALGPTVCVLEDLHWVDEATLEFLSFLVADLPRDLSLVLTYRVEDLESGSSREGLASRAREGTSRTTIALSRLAVDDIGTLAAAVLGAPEIPNELAIWLQRRTAGIPFAIEELVRLLEDRGGLAGDGGLALRDALAGVEVPPAVRDFALARLRPLGRDASLVTRAAAVLERPFDEQLVRSVAGLPPVRGARALADALSGALLEEHEEGIYGFRHSLAAQAVYEDTPTPERRRLHLCAARALEAAPEPRPLAQIAHQFKQADRPRQWLRYAEAAAASAHSAGDDRFASALLQEALESPALPRGSRTRMAIALGTAALYSPCPEPAISLLERTLMEEKLDGGTRGELRFSLVRLRSHAGDRASWQEEMLRVVEELRRRPALAVRAMVNLALPTRSSSRADIGEHLSWLHEAERVAARQDDPVANIAVTAQRAAILLTVGDPAGWEALENIPDHAHSVDEKLQLLRGYHSVSRAALDLGHYRTAERFLASAERIQAELDYIWWAEPVANLRASLDWRLGRWQGLESRVRSCGSRVLLASLLLARGDLEEAASLLRATFEAARAARSITGVTSAAGPLARLLLVQGDPEAASQTAAEAMEAVRSKGNWVGAAWLAPEAVDALLASGDRAGAERWSREFTTGVQGRDAPLGRAAVAYCQAALAEAEEGFEVAATSFARAERGWRRLPGPYPAARGRERRASCLLRGGDRRGAKLLIGALEEFESLGAGWDAARVRARLRTEGVSLPYPLRGGRRRYGDELSPREAQIAALAAAGKSNRQIAATLVLSPRTVAHHVSSVLHKLGIASRNDLAPQLEQLDLPSQK